MLRFSKFRGSFLVIVMGTARQDGTHDCPSKDFEVSEFHKNSQLSS